MRGKQGGRTRIARIQLCSLAEMLDCVFAVSAFDQGPGEQKMNGCTLVAAALERDPILLDGPLEVSGLVVQGGEVQVVAGVVRIELDCLGETAEAVAVPA